MSKKFKGADSILYNAVKGTLVTSGALTAATWYKIKAFGASTALPDLKVGSIFQTPEDVGAAITLASGDEVWPLTLSEVCKADVEISGEMGVIETTDSCDFPYVTNIADGYTNLSGSINTMMRFDEETSEIVSVTKDFLVKFFDIVEDDGEGTYTMTAQDDSDLLAMILLNKNDLGEAGKVTNWLIVPMILSSVSTPLALKDVAKADYSWSKGQGPAQFYTRLTPAGS